MDLLTRLTHVLPHRALSGLARRLADTSHLIPISGPRKPVFGIMPRNVQQTMAMDLLLDDDDSPLPLATTTIRSTCASRLASLSFCSTTCPRTSSRAGSATSR